MLLFGWRSRFFPRRGQSLIHWARHVVDGSSMEILMVAAELSPHARATSAADAVGALSKSLRQLGHEVTLAMPRYPALEEGACQLARRLSALPLRTGGEVTVFDGQLPSGVKLVAFDAPVLYDRPGVFADEHGRPHPDNAKRFGLLAQAAAALIRQRAQQGHAFDLVHLHDWPSAMVPLLARLEPGPDLPMVLTVHDGGETGQFPADDLGAFGLTEEVARDEGLLTNGVFSALEAGIARADVVTADSPSYAAELTGGGISEGVARAVRAANKSIVGILNGVDYSVYNPATDPLIDSRYDAEETGGKRRSKATLLRDLGLELELDVPLVALLDDRASEESASLVASALVSLSKLSAAWVIAGVQGTPALCQKVRMVQKRHPSVRYVDEEGGEAFMHRLLAAADLAVVPSPVVPNGLTAMTAQRYGAVPIVYAVGAHRDCVVDCDAALTTGTGFLYDEPTPRSFVATIARAVAAYSSRDFASLRRRVMRLDLGCERAARRYAQLYRQAVGARA